MFHQTAGKSVGLCVSLFVGLLLVSGAACLPLSESLIDEAIELQFNDSSVEPTEVVASGEAFFEREAVFESIPDKVGSHAATVAAFADGELLAAWYSYDGPHELDGSAIYMSRRLAGGEWSTPWVHIDRVESEGNPVLYSEGDSVWLFQTVTLGGWSAGHIELQTSTDRGRTWSSAAALPCPVGANVRFPPVRTADDTLLLPAYNDLIPQAEFYVSADGVNWELSGSVCADPAGIQPSVAVRDDGSLVAVMRNAGGGGWLWAMGSWDSGRSWSPPEDAGFPNPGSPAAIVTLASGNLLLVFNDSPDDRVPLTAALSADGGVSWPVKRNLVEGEGLYSYPSVVQTADGLIHVVFSVERARIDHIAFNEAWVTQSVDLPETEP
jgi:predicted neuraminidase